jgi:hypothetical protein
LRWAASVLRRSRATTWRSINGLTRLCAEMTKILRPYHLIVRQKWRRLTSNDLKWPENYLMLMPVSLMRLRWAASASRRSQAATWRSVASWLNPILRQINLILHLIYLILRQMTWICAKMTWFWHAGFFSALALSGLCLEPLTGRHLALYHGLPLARAFLGLLLEIFQIASRILAQLLLLLQNIFTECSLNAHWMFTEWALNVHRIIRKMYVDSQSRIRRLV